MAAGTVVDNRPKPKVKANNANVLYWSYSLGEFKGASHLRLVTRDNGKEVEAHRELFQVGNKIKAGEEVKYGAAFTVEVLAEAMAQQLGVPVTITIG